MGNPYLNPNESIILATHRVMVKSVSSDVILTSQRLLMVDTQNSRFLPVSIPLTEIETAIGAESITGEPEISLTITPPTKDEAPSTLYLTFSQWEGEEREHERDTWLERLKIQSVLARTEARNSGTISHGIPGSPAGPAEDTPQLSATPVKPELSVPAGTDITPPDEPGKAVPSVLPSRKEHGAVTARDPVSEIPAVPLPGCFHPPAPAKPGRSPVFITGAIVIAVLVIVGAIFLLPQLVPGNVTGSGNPAGTLEPTQTIPLNLTRTTVVTQSPTPSPTPTPEATPLTLSTPQLVPPGAGVWVQVNYNGNFTGSYGTPGRMRTVTSSGNRIYNIPAVNETVEAAIQKMDASGNTLTVEVYKNGKIAGVERTSAPQGYIDLHANLAGL